MPIDGLSVLFAQLTRDLLAIAKFLFLPRDATHSTDYAVARCMLVHRPSARLSVTRRYSDQTAKHHTYRYVHGIKYAYIYAYLGSLSRYINTYGPTMIIKASYNTRGHRTERIASMLTPPAL